MKKIFIAAFLLPFSLLADFYSDFPSTVNQARLVYFSAPTNSTSFQPDISTNSLFYLYFNYPFGLILNRNSIEYPSYTTNNVQNPNSLAFNQRLNYQLRSSISGSASYYSPLLVPEVRNLFLTASYLFLSGYRGPAFSQYVHYGTRDAFNVDFKLLVSDVLSSTNTVFHKVLLTSLASIDSNIDVLNSSLSSLASDYRSVNFSTFDFLSYLQGIEDNGVISSSQAQSFRQNFDSLSSDPSSQAAFVELAKSSIDSLHRLRNDVQNLSNMSNDPYSREQLNDIGSAFNGSLNNSLTSLGGSSASLNTNLSNFARLSTNWQNQVKQDLQEWRSDTTNRLAHMFDSPVPIKGGNNSSPVVVSGANGGPVGVAGTVHAVIDNLQLGVVIDQPVQIDHTQLNQISAGYSSIVDAITSFHDSFTDFTLTGNKPFNWVSFYQLFYEFQNQSLTNQVALLRNLNYTNILENIYVAITNKDTNVVISAALLDDYENFVDTSKFSSIVSSLPDDLRDSLSRFGLLDSSDYSGRWWVFQAANMALQSQLALTNAALASLLSSSLQSLDDYFSDDEDPQSGLLSRWLKMIDGLPDPEELQQTISEATNIVSNVGLERVTVLYDRATNDFSSVVSSVYSDRSLPPTLSFVLIPGKNGSPDRVVNIPVSDRSSLWSFIRQGMAFGLSVVTLILFPKYLLWLLAHYTRLLEKIIKSLHAYTEH